MGRPGSFRRLVFILLLVPAVTKVFLVLVWAAGTTVWVTSFRISSCILSGGLKAEGAGVSVSVFLAFRRLAARLWQLLLSSSSP